MGCSTLCNDCIDLLRAVLCGAYDLNGIVSTCNQITAAFHSNTSLAVSSSTRNRHILRFIGQPDHILGILRTETGRKQETIHCNAGQAVITAGNIVGILGTLDRNRVSFGAAIFSSDGNGHISGAVGRQVGRINADLCFAVVGSCLYFQLADPKGYVCGVAGGACAEGRTDGCIADRQALKVVIRGHGCSNRLGVRNRANTDIRVAIGSNNIRIGHLDRCAGGNRSLDLKGHRKQLGVLIDGIGKIVVVGHKPGFRDLGYVLFKEDGTPFFPDSLTQKWERFLANYHLPHIRLHDLRHSNATAMIAAGINAKVVQHRLGHANVSITLNTYTHVLPEMDQEAADKLNQALFANAQPINTSRFII